MAVVRELLVKFGFKIDKGSSDRANQAVDRIRKAATALVGIWASGKAVGGIRDLLVGEPVPRIESLAVLPLENLSGDPEQEYFADGMTEALIADLAKIGALKVISRTSAMRYKGTDKSLPEIGHRWGFGEAVAIMAWSGFRPHVNDPARPGCSCHKALHRSRLYTSSKYYLPKPLHSSL